MKQTATLKSLSGSLGRSVKLILTLLFLNFFTQNVSAQIITIDGNSGDWSNFCSAHVQDSYNVVGADNIFAGNEKDFFFAADWFWKLGTAKDKNDIANGAAALVSSVVVNNVTLTGSFLVFAGDRITNNGDAQIGFWFFQNGTAPVTVSGVNTFSPEKNGLPYPGDLLVLADFTGGGNNADVTVLMWTPGTGTYPNSDNNFTEVTTGAAVAENNGGPVPVPGCWNFTDKNTGSTTQYSTNEFYEGYINLADFITGGVTFCPSTYMLETRASQSITAVLDDFVGAPLAGAPTCSITGNNTICAGGSTCFTASGGTGSFTYNWSGPGGFTATGAVVCNLTAAGPYNVTVTNITRCTAVCTSVLTVNSAPSCIIDGNGTICTGTSTCFSASGGGSYLWSGPGGFSSTSAVICNLTAAGPYNLTVTSAVGGCKSTCSKSLTVNPLPGCDITGNGTICSGGSTCFTATGAGTYAWSGPGGFTATGAVICNLTAQGAYNLTVTSGAGCKSFCSKSLVVNSTPGCTIDGNGTICVGNSTCFTASGGISYVWSGPGGFSSTSAIICNLTAAGPYNLTVTASGGCTSTCSKTLIVNPLPECAINGNGTICAGSSTCFTATGGSTYSWSGPGGYTATGAVICNLTAAGAYNVTVTSAAGCKSTCSKSLTVNQNPSVNAGTDPLAQCRASVVSNGSLVLGTNVFSVTGTVNAFTTPNTPAWSVQANPAVFTVVIVSPNSLTTNVNVSGPNVGGTVTLRLTGTSNATPSCGTATDDVVLTLYAVPDVKPVVGSAFCPNITTTGSVSLLNSQLNVNYQLKDDANADVQGPKAGTGGTLTWFGLAEGNYTVIGTFIPGLGGCDSRSGPGSVIENPVPEVTITPVADQCNNVSTCVGLTATPTGGQFSGAGVTGSNFCPNGLAPGVYTVTYTYTNTAGCTASQSTPINVASCAAQICTYTQGYFGNPGGLSCDGTNGGLTTTQLINQSLGHWPGTFIRIGVSQTVPTVIQNYVQINDADAACIIEVMPGGGPAAEVIGANSICSLPGSMLKNGRIHNVLLAQTIALALNIGITSPSTLGSFVLQAGTLATAEPAGGCGSSVPLLRSCQYDANGALITPVPNDYIYRTFSQALIDAIEDAGYPKTVSGLFGLANDAIGNKDGVVGTEQGVSLSEIAGAAGSINEVFDECRISQGWIGPCAPTNIVAPPRITVSASAEAATIGKLKVSTFPNPYRNNVRFVIQSPVAGQAILDVYNIAGQKVQTLFNGHIDANETRIIDFKPNVANGMMIYTLRIGNQQVTGKLIGLKQ